MLTIILILLLFVSFFGMCLLIWKKLPELEAAGIENIQRKKIFPHICFKEKIKQWKPFKNFDSEKALRKMFLKIKILLLKAERKIDQCLHRVSYSQKFEKDYWDKLKKK